MAALCRELAGDLTRRLTDKRLIEAFLQHLRRIND
jgi:hypothetical protein